MPATKNDIKGLLAEHKNDLVHVLDRRFTAQDKRLRTEIKATEKRLAARIASERKILQIFLDQHLRKTNGLIEDVAQQHAQTHAAVTHTLDKQTDLEDRVDKLEQQTPPLL